MQIKAVVVGYGDRGSIYADYAAKFPEELKIEAVVDPDLYRLGLAKEKFNLSDAQCFTDFDALIQKGKIADCAIVATLDQLHYKQAKALLLQNYHLLLEKPIVNNSKELQELRQLATDKQRIIMVGHVLRYTPFYGAIKQAIADGEVGEIVHIETSELVGVSHSSSSYIRGKWNKENICGSGMLLAKCCHDIDLICWFNELTIPTEVVSYGDRNFILPEKAPSGSAERCYWDCPHIDTCKFSAKSLYVENDMFPHYSFPLIKKPHDKITTEEKLEALKTNDPMGVCAYKTGSDLVDHQSVMIKFENGSTAFHSMLTAVPRPGRKIHIIGTDGEIEGFFEREKFVIRKFDFKTSFYTEKEIDVSKQVDANVGHGGGDIGLMRDFVAKMRGTPTSSASTDIRNSISGHECVYAAEYSRKKNTCVKVNLK